MEEIITKTIQSAQVFTDSDGMLHHFEYNNPESLIEELYSYIGENYPTDEDIKITLSTDESFYWNAYAAHVCFGKGHITTNDLIDILLKNKEAQV